MPAAIVTGASRGIGRAIAEHYAADGYDIAVNYVQSQGAATDVVDTIETDTDATAIAVQADVSDPDAVARLIDDTVETFGGVDHLVNNAGIDQHVYTDALTVEDFNRILQVNLTGAFATTKLALPHLQESTVPEGPSVVNIASIQAYTGAAIECHYAASKAGIVGLTKSHARDFAPDIRVNAIAPGDIETDMTAGRTAAENQRILEGIPLDRFGQPEDIADGAAYLRDASFVTGETLNVNGGELMR
ncbi:MAG: SDR family NAD(P)-dependent oxidoreductase [Halobacteriales archaeon]